MKIWTERPAENDVEAVVRHYFGLVRAGKMPVAEKLVDHTPARHVLKALWSGSVGVNTDDDPVPDEWARDMSWLDELGLGCSGGLRAVHPLVGNEGAARTHA